MTRQDAELGNKNMEFEMRELGTARCGIYFNSLLIFLFTLFDKACLIFFCFDSDWRCFTEFASH
jgi:hypothetical protein